MAQGGNVDNDKQENLNGRTNITLDEYTTTNKFTIMSLNARSFNNKFQTIRDALHKIDPAVLCMQETWGENELTDYWIKKPFISPFSKRDMNLI